MQQKKSFRICFPPAPQNAKSISLTTVIDPDNPFDTEMHEYMKEVASSNPDSISAALIALNERIKNK
jgi:hypothetical protein